MVGMMWRRNYRPMVGDVLVTVDDRRYVRSKRGWVRTPKFLKHTDGTLYVVDPIDERVRKFRADPDATSLSELRVS